MRCARWGPNPSSTLIRPSCAHETFTLRISRVRRSGRPTIPILKGMMNTFQEPYRWPRESTNSSNRNAWNFVVGRTTNDATVCVHADTFRRRPTGPRTQTPERTRLDRSYSWRKAVTFAPFGSGERHGPRIGPNSSFAGNPPCIEPKRL